MTSEDAAVVAVLREQNWSRVGLAREVVRLRAERDRAREWIRRHAHWHGPGCACRKTERDSDCDCGLRASVAAVLASGEESREPASAGPAEEPGTK